MSDIMSQWSQRAIAARAARAEARNTNQTVSKTVVSNTQANNINANPVASLAASGTEYQALESPFSPDAYVATAGTEFFEGGEFDTSTAAPVVFPADLNQTQSTWMEIWSYKRTGTAVGSKNADTNFTAEPAVPGVSHICLPIFTGAGTAYGASWSEGEVTMANQLVTNAVGSGYDSAMETMKRQEASGFGERGRGGGGQNMGEVIASAKSARGTRCTCPAPLGAHLGRHLRHCLFSQEANSQPHISKDATEKTMAWATAGSRHGMGGYELQDHLSEHFFRPAAGHFANFHSSVGSNSEEI